MDDFVFKWRANADNNNDEICELLAATEGNTASFYNLQSKGAKISAAVSGKQN